MTEKTLMSNYKPLYHLYSTQLKELKQKVNEVSSEVRRKLLDAIERIENTLTILRRCLYNAAKMVEEDFVYQMEDLISILKSQFRQARSIAYSA